MTLMTSGMRSTIQRILTLILNSSHPLQRAYILNTLNVSIINAICGLTQQTIKVYFLILYIMVTLYIIMRRLLPTSVLQSFLTIFHYHVLVENVSRNNGCGIKSIGSCQYCKWAKSECKDPKTAEYL